MRERCTGENTLVLYSVPVLFFWASMAFVGVTYGFEFFNETHLSLDAPKGSASWAASQALEGFFPQKGTEYPFHHAVVVASKNASASPSNGEAVKNLTAIVLNSTIGSCSELPSKHGLCWWRGARGLFVPRTPADADLDDADFLSPDGGMTASMIVLTINSGFGAAGNPSMVAAWTRLQHAIDGWLATHGNEYEVGSTHEQMLLDAAQKAAIKDFERGDIVTLPIALLLLFVACGPAAALSLLTLPTTLLSTFYVLRQIASGSWFCKEGKCPGTASVAFPDFYPAILGTHAGLHFSLLLAPCSDSSTVRAIAWEVNMVIAVSLDYTLFILTRYTEEQQQQQQQGGGGDGTGPISNVCAIAATMRSAGRVVFISGITLAATFFGLTFCSEPVINSMGWGGAVTCIVAILVHLTLLPALLFFLGPCCRPFMRRSCWARLLRVAAKPSPAASSSSFLQQPLTEASPPDHASASSPSPSASPSASTRPPKSAWVILAYACREHRLKLLLANAIVLAPFAYLCTRFELSDTQALLTPRDSPALQTFRRMPSLGLSPGVLNPLWVLTYNRRINGTQMGCADDDLDVAQYIRGMHCV